MRFNWKRFWVRLGTEISCGYGGNGYFDNPEADNFISHNHEAQSVDQLKGLECLVLLGEPGLGKSVAIEQAFPDLDHESGGDEKTIWIRFRDIPDSNVFIREVFDDPRWQRWFESEEALNLILDGLDEGLIKIKDFLSFFTRQLRRYPIKRLNLLMTCRTADWPTEQGNTLANLWKLSEPNIWELCPLRQKDVELAAEHNSLVVEEFLKGLFENSLRPLAARPITLFFLIDQFKRLQGFKISYRDIYYEGIDNLCIEPAPERANEPTVRNLDPKKTKEAAALIAASLIYCGKSAITLERQEIESDLCLDSLYSSDSKIEPKYFRIALNTALFSSRGHKRFGISHQTFAECLAAQFASNLPLTQQISLLFNTEGNQHYIIPQLQETAAWLAGENEAFLEQLLQHDPEVILRSDVSRMNPDHKKQVIDAIIDKAQKRELFNEYGLRRFFKSYNHNTIKTQLLGQMLNRSLNDESRAIAMEIAQAIDNSDFETGFLRVLHDQESSIYLKSKAIHALEDTISAGNLGRLIPIAQKSMSETSDMIKGCSMGALVPRFWSLSRALPYLDRPSERNLGYYRRFLSEKAPKAITHNDIPALLNWLMEQQGCFDSLSPFNEIACGTVCTAARNLDQALIKEPFVQLWLHWDKNYGPPELNTHYNKEYVLWPDEETRLAFARHFFNHEEVSLEHPWSFIGRGVSLISRSDLEWALNELPQAPSSRLTAWSKLISALYTFEEGAPHMGLLLERIAKIPELKNEFDWLRAWNLEEPGARTSKARHLREQRQQRQYQKRLEQNTPDLTKISNSAKKLIQEGKFWAWINYSECFFRTEEGKHEYRRQHDITQSHGWQNSKKEEKLFAIKAARDFLISQSGGYLEFGAQTNYSEAGYRATWLLKDYIPADLELRIAIIQKWIPDLITFDLNGDEHQQLICALCIRIAPDGVLQALRNALPKSGYIFIWRVFGSCWNEEITSILCEHVMSHRLDFDNVKSSLMALHEKSPNAFLRFINRILPLSYRFTEDSRIWFNALAHALEPKKTWGHVLKALTENDDLASSVLLTASSHLDYEMTKTQIDLDVSSLLQLTSILHRLFPPNHKLEWKAGIVTARQSVADYRTKVADALTGSIDPLAESALLSLAKEFPDRADEFMRRRLSHLRTRRRYSWNPPSTDILQDILKNSESRYISSESDLFNVTLESLERFRKQLARSELPTAGRLWNWEKEGHRKVKHHPKEEEDFSDELASWLSADLRERGIIIGREVQIERRMKTDVLVKSFIRNDSGQAQDEITVVVEVKGCWHKDIKTGTEEQLVKDYLLQHSLSYGIYLVGWFCCPEWDWDKPNNKLNANTYEDAIIEVEHYAQEAMKNYPGLTIAGVVADCRFR